MGAQPSASTTASSTVNGTPLATVVDDPKLDVMSLRTMPLSVSTFGPLEPSPGNGPAVSSGISMHSAAAVESVVVEPDDVVGVDPSVVVDPAAGVVPSCTEQPTSAVAPTPASSVSARRR